jgi:hypothetical protein
VNNDRVIRCVLWATVVFNLGGGLLFAFPASVLGQLAGLPAPVPGIYATLLAFFVLLFAGAYAWLALQTNIDRPMIAFAAIGKAGAFAIIFIFWALGQAPGRGVLAATGDLVFAGLFVYWLLNTRQSARLGERGALP